MIEIADLPGAELVQRGLADLASGQLTVAALLVAIAARRLRRLEVVVPPRPAVDVELELYRALGRIPGVSDVYARYNSLRRELDSFIESLEHRRRRAGLQRR